MRCRFVAAKVRIQLATLCRGGCAQARHCLHDIIHGEYIGIGSRFYGTIDLCTNGYGAEFFFRPCTVVIHVSKQAHGSIALTPAKTGTELVIIGTIIGEAIKLVDVVLVCCRNRLIDRSAIKLYHKLPERSMAL